MTPTGFPHILVLGAAALALASPPALAQFARGESWDAQARASALSDEDVAYCTAVLKKVVEVQGPQLKPGDGAARDRLVVVTKAGFAFVGAMIKSGAKRDYADALLERAESVVERLDATSSPAQRQLERQRCEEVGSVLLKRASGVERAFISHKAKSRVQEFVAQASRARP